MANLCDYLYWRGDLPLDGHPFNPVDALALAWLASMPLPDPPPETLGETVSRMLRDDPPEDESLRFARLMADSLRFRDMDLRRFDRRFSEREELQFAAMTIVTGDNRAFVAYRGTDATLVGWKEDLNLSFSDEVPAQREAVRYLEETAALDMPLRVGGHSKGGNLAVYAASHCALEVRARIETVYNFDGPGQSPATMTSEGYRAVEPRLETFLPGSSIVGILLERSPRYHVVRSDGAGPMQHKPETWQVTPGGFELLDSLDWPSLYADRTIRDWLGSMSMDDRERFVEALYDVVGATQARTLDEIGEDWQRSGWRMLNAFAGLDLRTRAMLYLSLGKLIRAAVRNLDG